VAAGFPEVEFDGPVPGVGAGFGPCPEEGLADAECTSGDRGQDAALVGSSVVLGGWIAGAHVCGPSGPGDPQDRRGLGRRRDAVADQQGRAARVVSRGSLDGGPVPLQRYGEIVAVVQPAVQGFGGAG
jgi:hypothetical protein